MFCGERVGLATAAVSAASPLAAIFTPLPGDARHADAPKAAMIEIAKVTARIPMDVSCICQVA
jgi:hypothetical protein